MPLRCYLKIFELKDEESDKTRCPTISIYHSGSVNIIAKNTNNLYQALDFVKEIIKKYKDDIFIGELNF